MRLAVSSSNFNRFTPNPNNGLSMLQGQDGPFIVAENSVHLGGEAVASHLILPQVSLDQLPPKFVLGDGHTDVGGAGITRATVRQAVIASSPVGENATVTDQKVDAVNRFMDTVKGFGSM